MKKPEKINVMNILEDRNNPELPERSGRSSDVVLPAASANPAESSIPVTNTNPAVFLGRRTLQKLYLLLHLGRMLQGSHTVRLDTVNPSADILTIYDYCGLEIREYPDSETLQAELAWLWRMAPEGGYHGKAAVNADLDSGPAGSGAKPTAHLVDLPDKAALPEGSQCFLVTDTDRNSLEQAGSALLATGHAAHAKFSVHRIYLDIWEGSRIGIRYLEEMISRHFPANAMAGELLTLVADERNWAAIIDNQHDDRLRLSGLTQEYRRLLADLATIGFHVPMKESKKLIRLADRRKQAC
jgi:hypothetical protein